MTHFGFRIFRNRLQGHILPGIIFMKIQERKPWALFTKDVPFWRFFWIEHVEFFGIREIFGQISEGDVSLAPANCAKGINRPRSQAIFWFLQNLVSFFDNTGNSWRNKPQIYSIIIYRTSVFLTFQVVENKNTTLYRKSSTGIYFRFLA